MTILHSTLALQSLIVQPQLLPLPDLVPEVIVRLHKIEPHHGVQTQVIPRPHLVGADEGELLERFGQ